MQMFEHLLVFLVQRFRRLDSSARWYSVSRISIGLLPAFVTAATELPATGLSRALSLEQLTFFSSAMMRSAASSAARLSVLVLAHRFAFARSSLAMPAVRPCSTSGL